MRIVFFGSSSFGEPALRALAAGPGVVLVVTTQERPKGRGLLPQPSPIKSCARQLGLAVEEPDNPNSPEFVERLQRLNPDLVVLVAYRFILKPVLLELPRLGCVNLHPSLLPRYRGAAPIHRALIAGECQTGVTLFRMNEALDEGDIIAQETVNISDNETYGELSSRLSILGAELLMRCLPDIEHNRIQPIPQDRSCASYAPKIRNEERIIDWRRSAWQVHNLIRGLSPVPGAYTFLRGKRLAVLRSELVPSLTGPAGEVLVDNHQLVIAAAEGGLRLLRVRLEGGREISGSELINGQHLQTGERLGE